MESCKNKSKYNPSVDVLKFLFAVIIFAFHSKKLNSVNHVNLIPAGYMATEFFFIVSGYLMSNSSRKFSAPVGTSTYTFLKNKIKSFYPYFFFAFFPAFFSRFLDSGFQIKAGINIGDRLLLSLNELFLLGSSGIDVGATYNGPTWYISSMIIVMAIVFPLILKFRDLFINVAAPIIAIMSYAYISHNCNSLNSVMWNGTIMIGLLRALAGISLGCFCYAVVSKIKSRDNRLTVGGIACVNVFEVILLALIVWIMRKMPVLQGAQRFDYILVLLIFLLLIIVFSGNTVISKILPEKLSRFLGKFSLVLYLNHRSVVYFINAQKINLTFKEMFLIYLAISVGLTLLCYAVVAFYKFISAKVGEKIASLFVKHTDSSVVTDNN